MWFAYASGIGEKFREETKNKAAAKLDSRMVRKLLKSIKFFL
jgi:hypothetical protein